jgi:hypothetical protein
MMAGQVIVWAGALSFAFLDTVAAIVPIAIGKVAFDALARWWRVGRHDVGPDALRLLEDLDCHLDAYLLDHPDVAAGFDLLRAAVRDEQQEGGSA